MNLCSPSIHSIGHHARTSSKKETDAAMEAAGLLGLSPGFKFSPDDDELVEHFLLPRILGQQLPLEGVVLEDDPLRGPPWKLLSENGRKEDEAFFFAAGQAIHGGDLKSSGRQKRSCVCGGFWEGQRFWEGSKQLLPSGGGAMAMEVLRWRKNLLNFHEAGGTGSTGWVMHEYAVTSPAALASSPMRAYRIKFSGHGKKRKRGDSCGGAGDEEDEDDRGLAAWQRPISGSVFPDQDSSSLLQAASSDDDQPPPPPPLDSFQGLGSSSYDAAGRPMIAAASDQDGAPAENVVNFEAFWNFELADLENVSLDGFLNFDQQHTVLD